MTNTILATLLFLVAPAQQTPRPPMVGILANIVEERDAKIRAARARDPKNVVRELLVDVGAFSRAVEEETGLVISRNTAAAALQGRARPATYEEAHRCAPWQKDPKFKTCWIVNDAAYLRVDSIQRTETGYDVFVTSFISGSYHPGGRPPMLEFVKNRISFAVQNGKWVKTGQEQTAIT